MIHPSMSEWPEWPLMTGRHVPFGRTRRGGTMKALGNPGVYWQVAACVACSAIVAAGMGLRAAWSAAVALKAGPRARAAALAIAASHRGTVWAVARGTNDLGGGGWFIPFFTLLFGYFINLVPYQLIKRSKCVAGWLAPDPSQPPPAHPPSLPPSPAPHSAPARPPPVLSRSPLHIPDLGEAGGSPFRGSPPAMAPTSCGGSPCPPPSPALPRFVYHYIPALLMGIQLLTFVCHVALSWAGLDVPSPPLLTRLLGSAGAAAAWRARPLVAASFVGGVFTWAALGFWYWGAPYAYGLPLTPQQHQARHWYHTW
jgi:hypothetical protein